MLFVIASVKVCAKENFQILKVVLTLNLYVQRSGTMSKG